MIAVGVIWLLGNLNLGIPPFNFLLLLQLWPLLLVVAGINLIIGRRWPLLRAFITLLAVAGALAYVYLAPIYGFAPSAEIKHAEFSEPLGTAETATIVIGSSVGHVSLSALETSTNLFEADLDYVGEVTFVVDGTTDKTVRLDAEAEGFDTGILDAIDEDELQWTLGVSPEVPVTLEFSSGVGEFTLDLTGLTITGVSLNGGVGQTDLLLPAQDGSYSVRVNGGVGRLLVTIADGAEVDLRIDGGVGEIVIDVPADAGVEVNADLGVGNINVPADYVLLSGGTQPIASSGVWESPNFAEAEYRIAIDFDGGVGNLVIK
jgi:hypothetical protein